MREMSALARAGGSGSYAGGTGEMSAVYDATKGWGTMRLRYMGSFGQPGINYALLPRTRAVLRHLPLAPETAAFQRQLPGTGLPMHVDPSNFVLGCHLGVIVPPAISPRTKNDVDKRRSGARVVGGGGGSGRGGFVANQRKKLTRGDKNNIGNGFAQQLSPEGTTGAVPREGWSDNGGSVVVAELEIDGNESMIEKLPAAKNGRSSEGVGVGVGERAWIEVAGEKQEWDEGRAFVFDPSFLHRTYNPTLQDRVILNVDIWHPGLADVEKRAVQIVCELVEQWNARSGLFA